MSKNEIISLIETMNNYDELAAKVARFTELYDRCERPKVAERQSMSDPEPEEAEKTEA